MSIRLSAVSSLAVAAVALAQQPLAAQEIPYTGYDDTYQAPTQVPVEPSAYYSDPVVQPVETNAEYRTGYEAYREQPAIAPEPPVMAEDAPRTVTYTRQDQPAPDYAQDAYYPEAYEDEPPIAPDVAPAPYGDPAWRERCEADMRSSRERGQVAGAIIGGAAGAVVGNRVAGRGDRLAGTLIGGGVGALGGAAVGSAVAGGPQDECRALLAHSDYDDRYADDYRDGYAPPLPPRHGGRHYAYRVIQAPPPPPPMRRGRYHAHGYPGGYAYGYGATTVIVEEESVPLVPVVREYVTEEWVEVDQPRPAVRKRVIHRPAQSKRVKYVKRSK